MAKLGKPRSTKGLAVLCAKVAENKIAKNILLLNLTAIDSAPADYFVICSCDSDNQIRAVVGEIESTCRDLGIQKPKIEGLHESASWVLADFFDVVMHIMLPTARSFYQLEKLWGDAEFKKVDEAGKTKAVKLDEIKMMYLERE